MQNMYVVMHNESQSGPTCGELSEVPKNITLYQIIENVNFLLLMKYIIIVKMCVGGGLSWVRPLWLSALLINVVSYPDPLHPLIRNWSC